MHGAESGDVNEDTGKPCSGVVRRTPVLLVVRDVAFGSCQHGWQVDRERMALTASTGRMPLARAKPGEVAHATE